MISLPAPSPLALSRGHLHSPNPTFPWESLCCAPHPTPNPLGRGPFPPVFFFTSTCPIAHTQSPGIIFDADCCHHLAQRNFHVSLWGARPHCGAPVHPLQTIGQTPRTSSQGRGWPSALSSAGRMLPGTRCQLCHPLLWSGTIQMDCEAHAQPTISRPARRQPPGLAGRPQTIARRYCVTGPRGYI